MKFKVSSEYILDHFKLNLVCVLLQKQRILQSHSLMASSSILNLLVVQILGEIRPYLTGTGGGILEFVQINDYVVIVRLSGPAAGVMTVRVALSQKLREKIPSIAAVQLIE